MFIESKTLKTCKVFIGSFDRKVSNNNDSSSRSYISYVHKSHQYVLLSLLYDCIIIVKINTCIFNESIFEY